MLRRGARAVPERVGEHVRPLARETVRAKNAAWPCPSGSSSSRNNRARQAAITTEIIEISSGAEALKAA